MTAILRTPRSRCGRGVLPLAAAWQTPDPDPVLPAGIPLSSSTEQTAPVPGEYLAANPDLSGCAPMQVYDACVEALTGAGVG
jgi:hypothetical protein